jgi:hypothetical protein
MPALLACCIHAVTQNSAFQGKADTLVESERREPRQRPRQCDLHIMPQGLVYHDRHVCTALNRFLNDTRLVSASNCGPFEELCTEHWRRFFKLSRFQRKIESRLEHSWRRALYPSAYTL